MILAKLGRKIARIMEALESPRLFDLWRRRISIKGFLELNQHWLLNTDIKTVFDIGANTGQFARLIHEVLPDAFIYSFEPLEECYQKLKTKEREIANFKAFNIALGDTDGEIEFYRNEFPPSSSILPMADLHKQNYPFTDKEYLLKVKVARLDDIARDLVNKDNLLIKIDVQGYEDKVIAGGTELIKKAKILIIETSFLPLYVGQPLFENIYDSLRENFRYMGALSQSRNLIDGSILQEDSIFMRKPNIAVQKV
ncbi:MAG: FkbM family methyltransferase [Alphaproteobacteria bacterium]|nr:MAG: FkbM family methyltransferase [Alphaproteobacteria bacterium]